MNFRPSRHQTRHIASAMLFVWLFAVVASWANACVLEPRGSAKSSRVHGERNDPPAQRESAHEGAAGTRGELPGDAALQACASFCDTGQNIVAKAQPGKSDGIAEQVALVAVVSAGWPAFTPRRADAHWRPIAAPPPPRLPVFIAFLRLTI
ncbi:MAG: hypothetical protein Q8N17_11145 [Burkholderiaceae bacterium]|nr:hypothetical protein [Burkholderiaceae bacterium]